jgi:hypothetical protein
MRGRALPIVQHLRLEGSPLQGEAADRITELYEALVEAERCIADAEVEFGCKYSGLQKVRAALAKARGGAA